MDHEQQAREMPAEFWESLQRLIENAAVLGPASQEDALLVARYRGHFTALIAREERMRVALLSCARQAEALKRECGMDQESAQAVRNAQYQAISTTAHIALGTIRGPAHIAPEPAQPDWLHLKPYGYAPGHYMGTCADCGEQKIDLDKLARRCRPCAEKLFTAAQPVEEAPHPLDAIFPAPLSRYAPNQG